MQVTYFRILQKAKEFGRLNNIQCKFSKGWLSKFLKRYKLCYQKNNKYYHQSGFS